VIELRQSNSRTSKKLSFDRRFRHHPKNKSKALIADNKIKTITGDKSMSYYRRKKLSESHKKRAGIEAVIGHLKSDHKLNRNFYKGIFGNNINVMLVAAAFNFKRMMNKWKKNFFIFFKRSFYNFRYYFFIFFYTSVFRRKIKMTFY